MPSTASRVLGRGSVLASLRTDLRGARSRVDVFGPWIDGWTAEQIVAALQPGIALRVLLRPRDGCEASFATHRHDACAVFAQRAAEVRELAALHAKVIAIDGALAYVGSANWYRYSLEESLELVVRAPFTELAGLAEHLEVLWSQGDPTSLPCRGAAATHEARRSTEGRREELVDPVAAAVLRSVGGTFVIGRRPARGSR